MSAELRVLVLSPHADDAALSLGGWLAQLAGRANVTIATVFSRSRWAPHSACHLQLAPATRLRQEEDRRYAVGLGAGLRFGGAADCSCDGRTEDHEERGLDPRLDPRAAACHAWVRATSASADVVVAPLAIGQHIDHAIVNAAARALPVPTLWYEDLPYAAEPGAATDPPLRSLGGPMHAWRATFPAYLKAAALRCYPSQLSAAERRRVLAYARRGDRARERLWTSRPDAAPFGALGLTRCSPRGEQPLRDGAAWCGSSQSEPSARNFEP